MMAKLAGRILPAHEACPTGSAKLIAFTPRCATRTAVRITGCSDVSCCSAQCNGKNILLRLHMLEDRAKSETVVPEAV